MSDKLRQFLVVFGTVSKIIMNGLSNTGTFGGQTNATVSAKYPTLITPAGWAFSIWGLIFLGLLAFAIYQALPSQRTNIRFRTIGAWVLLNVFCNAIWSPLFNQEWIGVALVVILTMLFSSVVIEQRLLARPYVSVVVPDLDATLPEAPASLAETWLARVPFAIYFGWLTVATIVNVAVYLKATEFGLMGLSEQTWAMAILIVGMVVGSMVFNRYRAIAYILVFTWAYAAIAMKQQGYEQVQLVAGVGSIVAVVLAIMGIISKKIPAYT